MHSRLPRQSLFAAIALAMMTFTISPVSTPATAAGVDSTFGSTASGSAATQVAEGTQTISPQEVPAEAVPESVTTEEELVTVKKTGDGELSRKTVEPFRMAGVTWESDPNVTGVKVQVQVRTNGVWSSWTALDVDDLDIGRAGTDPLWLNEDADGIAVKIETQSGVPADVQVSTINPDGVQDTGAARANFVRPASSEGIEEAPQFDSASVSRPAIKLRSSWGAGNGLWGQASCKAPVVQAKAKGITLHHTAGSNTAKKADSESIIKGYQTYHVKSRGWCDIGYAFLVDRWGQIFEGRKGGITKQVTGAHAGVTAVNKEATGIAMMGNFEAAEPPAAMKEATVHLAAWRMSLFGTKPTATFAAGGKTYKVIHGHRDAKATACPGKNGYRWLNEKGGMRDRVDTMVAAPVVKEPVQGPVQPTGVAVSAVKSSSATVTWKAVPGATRYRVVYRLDPADKAITTHVNSPSITLTGLKTNSAHVVAVATVVGSERSARTKWTKFRTNIVPVQPTGVAVSAVKSSSSTVKWKAVPGATRYRVLYRLDPADKAITTHVNSPSITLTGLKTNSAHVVSVVTMVGSERSARTKWTKFRTNIVPVRPTGVAVSAVKSSSSTVKWKAVPGATRYRVLYRLDPADKAKVAYANSPSITLTGLDANSAHVVSVVTMVGSERSARTKWAKFRTAASATPKPAPTSAVTLNNSFKVPASGSIVIKGHGFGHGNGMSQHGAQGAARQGVKYATILSHYYPGTTLGTKSGNIRVQLTKVTNSEVKVVATNGLKFRNVTAGTVVTLPTTLKGGKVTTWNIKPRTNDKKQSTLMYKVGPTWYTHSHFTGTAQFEGPAAIEIYHPDQSRHKYRGALRSVPRSKGATTRHAVNVLPIETYVKGVVAREMPSGWHSEALKAQSVAARTYGVRSLVSGGTHDICDTTSCQVYGGVAAETSNTNKAVDGTKGRVLMYAGKPAFAQYSSSSGGWTNQGSQPYLKPVRDDWDNFSGNSVHNWTLAVGATVIEKKHPSIGKLQTITVTKRNGYGNGGGRVSSVTLKGSKGSKVITGVQARWDFGMRSDWFGF